jgi:hypothetical protein
MGHEMVKLLDLGVVEAVSNDTVRRTLNKMN